MKTVWYVILAGVMVTALMAAVILSFLTQAIALGMNLPVVGAMFGAWRHDGSVVRPTRPRTDGVGRTLWMPVQLVGQLLALAVVWLVETVFGPDDHEPE